MNRLIHEDALLDNFKKCYCGHLGMEESDMCMTFKGICNVIKNTESADNDDIYIKAIEDFISWAYVNGIDFSYMAKGDKSGKWFCDNVKERFLTGKKIYFIPFAKGLEFTDDDLLSILEDERIKELLKTNSLFVEFDCNENTSILKPYCKIKDEKRGNGQYDSTVEYGYVDITIACCRVKDIKTNGCYITITDNDSGVYLKNLLDEKADVYMAKSIFINGFNPTKFRLDKFNVIVGG